jgi:hypothetical protein
MQRSRFDVSRLANLILKSRYALDQGAFFADYASAHKKLSELGSKFVRAGGIRI